MSKRLTSKGWELVKYAGRSERESDFVYMRNKVGSTFTLMEYKKVSYLLYHSPPLYGLLSCFHIKRFQRFKGYKISHEDAQRLNLKGKDKSLVGAAIDIGSQLMVCYVLSAILILGGFAVTFLEQWWGSILWFTAAMAMRCARIFRHHYRVEKGIGKSLSELEYEHFRLKIKKTDDTTPLMRYLFPILVPMGVVAMSQVWHLDTVNHFWEYPLMLLMLIGLLLVLDGLISYPSSIKEVNRWGHHNPTGTKMYAKKIEKSD